jgi:hypothetical protein
MASLSNQPERWRWPQFTIRELLLVTAGLAAFWKLSALQAERNGLPYVHLAIMPSFMLLWFILCWRTIRLNSHFFRSRNRGSADNVGQVQIPPSRLRDAWFIVFPIVVISFYTHWSIYIAMKGTATFSPVMPEGYPGHVSWAVAYWAFTEMFAVAFLWISTGAWVCVMIERHPFIRCKLVWKVSAVVVSPIVSPLVYFTKLRPKNIANIGQPQSPPASDRPAGGAA